MKNKRIGIFSGLLFLCLLALLYLPGTADADRSFSIYGKNYELPDSSDYELSDGFPVNTFFYGDRSMGFLCITGQVEKSTTYNELSAYGVTGPVSIYYQYNGRYQSNNLYDRWHVDNDGTAKVNSYGLGFLQAVGNGCIIIEKSADGKNWEIINDPIKNYFTGVKSNSDALIYSISEKEIKNGCYYRILVAYRFCKRIGDGFWWIGDRYEYKKCIELYTFYVCSDKNYVTITDLGHRLRLKDHDSTDIGFVISKNDSQATVTVQGDTEIGTDFAYFVEPGEYHIDIETKLGDKYKYDITVTDGMDLTEVSGKTYSSKKDKGYPLMNPVSTPIFGKKLTTLYLGTTKDAEIKQNNTGFGIRGDKVSLYLKLNMKQDLGYNWHLVSDSKEKVNDVLTGKIGTGALVVQTSGDGKNWKTADRGRYMNGLYTTDYANHYGKEENVLIYTPSGEDVLNGIHIRVLYAYETQLADQNDYRDYVECYEFYLCNDELEAVTFHNLSVKDTLEDKFSDVDKNTVEVYKKAETLVSGSYTTTGFEIDKTLNPAVNYTVACNGKAVTDVQTVYDKTGRYDIDLTSGIGSTGNVTIYVDRSSPEEAMRQYFEDGFISGKRIFSEGEYPVFEAEETTYHVSAQDSDVLPLYGRITNTSTGSVITVEQTPDEKTGILSEPGDYEAVFSTSKDYFDGELTGDARVFTFHFRIIPKGTAPGPVVNQKLLDEYSHSTVVDSNPVYYGLTYSSAGKGNITIAFASKEAAIEYAYQYEKGTVELQENGEYRYTGSAIVDQKTKYESPWDLTDDINAFAETTVRQHYFNMADEFTYLSLTSEVLDATQNLRQLELDRSVTVFADGQKEELTDTEGLPFLNDKLYAYLDPATGEVDRGHSSFEFITDQYGGIDSKVVTITDSEGGQHSIRYSESVGQQLLADNCPSGIVTIREETMYGDSNEYQAVYIAPGDNRTEVSLAYTYDGKTRMLTVTGDNKGMIPAAVDSFAIHGLSDPLDPYAFVIVKHNQNEEVFTVKDGPETTWTNPGEYSVTCHNRMGYGYTFKVFIGSTEENAAVAENTPELTDEPVITPEPVAEEQTTETPNPTDVLIEQEPKPASQEDEESSAMLAKTSDEKDTGDNRSLIIIGAGLILLVALIIFAYRRIRMFSRAAENMKSKEDDKHE